MSSSRQYTKTLFLDALRIGAHVLLLGMSFYVRHQDFLAALTQTTHCAFVELTGI